MSCEDPLRVSDVSSGGAWPPRREGTICIPVKPLTRFGLFGISVYWLAVNLHWSALLVAIVPHQVAVMHPTGHGLILSFILGAGALVALVMPPVVGAYSDHCAHPMGRRRPYMLAGTASNLLGLALLCWAGENHMLGLYLAGYMVVQFGSNLATAAYSGVIPDIVPPDQRGAASGWMAAMTQMGNILGALGGGVLIQRGHALAAYGIIGGMLVLLLTITVVTTRETALSKPTEKPTLGAIIKSLWIDPRHYPDFAWVWFTRFLFTAGMWMVQPFIQYYLRDVIGSPKPAEDAGRIIGVALVGATVTGLIGGSVSDRLGRKRVVYAANGLMAVVALAFMVVRSMEAVYVTAVVYGLAFGAYYSVDWALGCDVLPRKEEAGKDMGVWHISMVLPQSLAPFLSGLLLTLGGSSTSPAWPEPHYALQGYVYLFVAASFLLALSAVLLKNVRGVR